jgi:methyl-accepting chemotaxis protein
MRLDLKTMAQGSTETLTAAIEAETAATEAQRGAEQVATAAEEQSAGANEAQAAVRQQAQSLEQGQIAAKSIARLAEELRSGGVTLSSAEQIAASSEELSATVQELSSAATEVMAAVDQISRGAQLQAAAAQQTSAALGQIESGARLAQRNAARAREQVEVAKTALGDGEAAVGRLALGMESAVAEVGGALAVILRLETMGRRIVAIVDEITLATVQTSMLAVSGSVEAARAGGAGRGFAVVSGDIRNLARGAGESVARIRETVLGVLDQIATLRRELEQVIAAAEVEAQNNRSVMSGFDKIKLEVEALREASGAISAGAEDILSAAMQTASGARQIAAAAEQASVATREAAAASAEQARSAEDLAAAIEEIASLADALRQENA